MGKPSVSTLNCTSLGNNLYVKVDKNEYRGKVEKVKIKYKSECKRYYTIDRLSF